MFNSIVEELFTQDKPILFMCIGTDKHVWDSIGAITGSMLYDIGILSYGNLDYPITSLNVEVAEANIRISHPNHCVIAVDASITNDLSKHKTIEVIRGGIKPGNGVGKNIKMVGDYSLLYNIHSDKVDDKMIRDPYNGAKNLVSFIKNFIIK